MGEVGRTAIRIGEQLESVANERQRAQAAYDLVDYYNLFAKGDTVRLDSLRKEGRDGRRKVAVLLRRLTIVAKEVDLPTAEKVQRSLLLFFISKYPSILDARQYRKVLRKIREGHVVSFRSLLPQRRPKDDACEYEASISITVLWNLTVHCSIVHKPFWISTEVLLAYKCM